MGKISKLISGQSLPFLPNGLGQKTMGKILGKQRNGRRLTIGLQGTYL